MNTFGIINGKEPLHNITVTLHGSRQEAQKRLNNDIGAEKYVDMSDDYTTVDRYVPSSLKLFPIS